MDVAWQTMEGIIASREYLDMMDQGILLDDHDIIGVGIPVSSVIDSDIEEDDGLWTDVDGVVSNLLQT